MKVNLREVQKHRSYSEEFKREMVSLFEKGKFSVVQLERLYRIDNSQLYKWIYKYSTFNKKGYRIVEMKTSATNKLKELENQVKELERLLGQKQVKIDFLEKMIDLAKDEYGIDVKKNSSTPQSNGSAKKEKK